MCGGGGRYLAPGGQLAQHHLQDGGRQRLLEHLEQLLRLLTHSDGVGQVIHTWLQLTWVQKQVDTYYLGYTTWITDNLHSRQVDVFHPSHLRKWGGNGTYLRPGAPRPAGFLGGKTSEQLPGPSDPAAAEKKLQNDPS